MLETFTTYVEKVIIINSRFVASLFWKPYEIIYHFIWLRIWDTNGYAI